MYCKDADRVVMEKLGTDQEQRRYFNITVPHLEEFAKEGLRTLCLGVSNVPV